MNNLELMKLRLNHLGGNVEGRMIKGKATTLDKAFYASYQAADAIIIPEGYKQNELDGLDVFRCLINPNLNKQDYDEKIISAQYSSKVRNGSVIKWVGTGTHWLIYLRELTEDAYFRGAIRRARYTINFKDEDGSIVSVYAAVRGPVETKINYLEKGNFRTDTPNWSLDILIPANKVTLKNLDRYSKFAFQGKIWETQVVDTISTPGVIQVTALENYINKDMDDMENELAFGLVEEVIDPNPDNADVYIDGNTFVKPTETVSYSIVGVSNGKWKYDSKLVCAKKQNSETIELEIITSKSGQTVLEYVTEDGTSIQKIIVIESLF